MRKVDAISIVQFTLILMTAVGLKNHVMVIPFLLQKAGRDAWISIFLSAGVILIWSFLLLYIHKKTKGKNIFEWIEHHIGKIPCLILSIVICFYIVFLAAATLKETLVWTEATYLPETPRLFTASVVIILCFCLANTNLQTIAMSNVFVLLAVVVLGFFVGISNFQFKDFTLLKPILEHGFAPVFSGMIYQLSGLIEIIFMIFLQHKIYDRIQFKHLVINVGILIWLTLGPIIGSITEFGPTEAAKQMYPAYEQWAIVSIGKFIEHLDFFSIYQWLSGNFIRVSFYLFISLETLRLRSKRNKSLILALFCFLTLGYQLIPVDTPVYYWVEKEILMPMTFWFLLSVSILLAALVLIFNKKSKEQQHVQEKV